MTFNIFICRLLLSIYLWVEALVISYVIKSSYTNFYSNHQSLCILIISYTYNDIFSHFVLYSEFLMWFYLTSSIIHWGIFIYLYFIFLSVMSLFYVSVTFLGSFFLSCIYMYSLYILDIKSLSRITHANFTYSLEFALSFSMPCDGLILWWFPIVMLLSGIHGSVWLCPLIYGNVTCFSPRNISKWKGYYPGISLHYMAVELRCYFQDYVTFYTRHNFSSVDKSFLLA